MGKYATPTLPSMCELQDSKVFCGQGNVREP